MNKPNPHTPESVTPLPSEISKLTPQAAALRVVEQSTVANRAFILVAMLLLHLETTLKAGQTLGGVVIKLAKVPDAARRRVKSTIDNARYAMRVWKELVTPGHITAEAFHDFTYGDCLTINKAMSGKARQPCKAPDVALILQASPKNWHEELECLFTYGQTTEERAAAEAKQSAKKADKTADTTVAEGSAGVSPATEGVSPSESTESAETADATTEAGDEPAPGKVVQMPKAKPVAEDAFKVLVTLEQMIGQMEASEVEKVAPALAELNATVQSSVKPKKAAKQHRVQKPKVSKPKTKAA